jgi:hypothetical protein
LYVFDQKRQAVLLLGGNKQTQDRFYEKEIPRAERIWEQYLKSSGSRTSGRIARGGIRTWARGELWHGVGMI